MKKVKFLKIKSFLLAMLILLSLAIVVSGDEVKVADADIHDINCKFSCEHDTPFVPFITEAVDANAIIENNSTIILDSTAMRVWLPEPELEYTEEIIQEILRNLEGKSPEELVGELANMGFQEILRNLEGKSPKELAVGLVDGHTSILASCPPHSGSSGTGTITEGCLQHIYSVSSCRNCGLILSMTYLYTNGSHTWTNGGICGKQCTKCGIPQYNPGHGPGSGHSWCTND